MRVAALFIGIMAGITGSLAARIFVELGVQELAANSLLDASNSQVFMGYPRRTGLYRAADMKPVFPDAWLNRFEGIFYPFVTHRAHCPFASGSRTMSNNT